IVSKVCKNWDWTTNHEVSELGRIWVVWDPRVISFEVLATNEQAIHGRAVCSNGMSIHLSFVYGLCDYRTMADFNACLNTIEVDEIRSAGRFFTWTNKREGRSAVNKKLDRALGNWGWHRVYNHSSAHFHNPGVSDHSPISVALDVPWRTCNKPFKFLNCWTNDGRFVGVVKRVWGQKVHGNPMEVVLCKLRNLKRELKLAFNHPDPRPKDAIRADLDVIQSRLLLQPSDQELIRLEKATLHKLNVLKAEEESYYRQKSRITWLKLGDSNTKFFHRSVASLHHRNHITKLQRVDGSWACTQKDIEQLSVAHFSGLLGTPPSQTSLLDYPKRLTEDQRALLGRNITDSEIRNAFWALHPEKAPGPDGFNGFFFRSVWGIVEKDMVDACRFFFNQPYMPKGLNATIIALVPKSKHANSLNDFRPIDCCNFLYKVLS
ncbi:LOW QUALITY PROTEIN: hypothetical protein CFOL_v3_35566, partial [Cephalotus follicularis]